MTDLVEVNLVKGNLVNENLDELCLERFILPRPSREALLEGLVSPRRGRCVTRRDATQHRRPTPPPTPSNTRTPSAVLLPLCLLGLACVLGVIAAGAFTQALNSSGRGLDTDEWEVDHSVWMDQLQKDFEDSWSTE